MANFTLQLTVGVAKGAAASWFYAQNSVGHSYANPVDVQIGDTVTFTRAANSNGTAKVRLLNIFTNNADIDLTSSSPTVVRTVASGGTTVDYISGTNQGGNRTDSFFLERQAATTDTTPNAFTFNSVTSAGLSSVYQSVAKQVTGITGTVNVSVSGSGSPQVKIGSGSWTSGSTTITNNYYINVRLTSSASNSTAHTATVTVGTYSTTFSVTTVAAAQGGGGPVTGGSGTYGIEIYDTNGTTTVLSPSTRYISFMTLPATVVVAAGATVLFQQDMTGLSTSNSDIAFRGYGNLLLTISRVTTGPISSQGFNLYNHGTASQTVFPYILRF